MVIDEKRTIDQNALQEQISKGKAIALLFVASAYLCITSQIFPSETL
ncbi:MULTISPECIES: hypothetical protein [Pseudanabaena]|uniref:Uncharacterized protein n=1 Tax=Pseudanabaena catenata USMAC16 TaxID=1855837 RepID=A0A9X4RJL2_9CYAN|nr:MULTISPECIES: hypothetical protein [Pseudanabaena]MDG3492974.1 hypothetical protein [Pseudanabaena catenata USMAC16]